MNEYLKANQYMGLLKFFREEEHLNQFLDGHIYCNTPEYYRCSPEKGISDKNDSCMFSIIESRGDSKFSVEIGGLDAGFVSDFIVRNGRKEGWLHCWAILKIPETDVEFNKLSSDIELMKRDFGPYYVFVNAQNSNILTERIKRNIDVDIEAKEVIYFDIEFTGLSIFNKHSKFSYQREFRFVFDECSSSCEEPRSWYVTEGFRDIAKNSPNIKITASSDDSDFNLIIEKV